MNKLLIIYNIAEVIQKRDNSTNYLQILSSLFTQNIIKDCRIIISGCKVTDRTKKILRDYFDNKVSYNWIEDAIPINITYNLSVLEGIKTFGEFDGYLYMDSGTIIETSNGLELIHNKLQNRAGIVSVLSDADSGLAWWFNIADNDIEGRNNLFKNGDLIMPIGSAVNGICYAFSKEFQQFYEKLIPDIFAGYCVESVYTFLCAAINTHWLVTNQVKIRHWHAMEGGSQCSNPIKWKEDGNKPYDHPFIINSIIERINNGVIYGIGYEEHLPVIKHDPSKFDKNGFAIYPELKEYIKNNLYLKESEFNYKNINYEWIN